ncbi:hypothetical protein C3L33_08508, partial [Rhododendron williamsianum]
MQLNASRIKVLQAQDDVVNSMKEAAAKELLKAKSDQRIRNQVKNLDILYCSSRYFREKEMKDERVVDFVDMAKEHGLTQFHWVVEDSKYAFMPSLLRLKEPAVLLRCRKEDLDDVEIILNSAKHEYAEKANVHAPEILMVKISLLSFFLFFFFSSGGVVLASRDGKIVFENTLDARLDVVFRKKLPEVSHFLTW